MRPSWLFILLAACGDESARHIADAALLTCETTAPAATCARLGPDFVTTATGMNPAGPWSYGYATALGGPFVLFTTYLDGTNATLEGLTMWGAPDRVDNQGAHLPTLGINATATRIDPIGTYTVDAGQVLAHPGPSGEYTIARWTAPAAGTYRVQATFGGLSGENNNPPTTTDVHILNAGSSIFDGEISIYGPTGTTCNAAGLTLAAGDTIDFAVGIGSNHTYFSDSTSIDAAVCPSP